MSVTLFELVHCIIRQNIINSIIITVKGKLENLENFKADISISTLKFSTQLPYLIEISEIQIVFAGHGDNDTKKLMLIHFV